MIKPSQNPATLAAMFIAALLVIPDDSFAAQHNLRRAMVGGTDRMKEKAERETVAATLSGLPVPSSLGNTAEEGSFWNVQLVETMASLTPAPTSAVTTAPPVMIPTSPPTAIITASPTASPTSVASGAPTETFSGAPSAASGAPSVAVTEATSSGPTTSSTDSPTEAPTLSPTTSEPSGSPSGSPVDPTPSPTASPTLENCNVSPAGRAALINIFLRVVSSPVDVDTPGSPQALALNWIIDEDPAQLCPQDVNLIQRYVMAVFYFSTRGDRWTECSAPPPMEEVDDPEQAIAEANAQCTLEVAGFESGSNAWLTGASECTWGGLGCNQDKVITRIEFEQNGVAGTLPYELSRIQTLQNLILEEGILTGTIPKQLSEIRSLEQIDLNFNLLQGPIPEELYGLSNLRQMDLNDNELTGTISSAISGLSRLSFFQFENNMITGEIPTTIGLLEQLEVATMDNNQLSGTMPCSFMNTTGALKVLTADCLGAPNRPSPPLITCDCCTQCF